MVSIQSSIFATLGQFAGVSGIVGARIYPDVAPQQVTKPYVVWQEISTVPVAAIDVGTKEDGGLTNYRIQITSWGLSQTVVRDLDKQVRLAMQAATAFKSTLVDGRALDYEPDTKLFGFASDFSVWLRT